MNTLTLRFPSMLLTIGCSLMLTLAIDEEQYLEKKSDTLSKKRVARFWVKPPRCYECPLVKKDNTCFQGQHYCRTRGFCYTRSYSKGSLIRKIKRGCTWDCKHFIKFHKGITQCTWCCSEDYCNIHDAWWGHH